MATSSMRRRLTWNHNNLLAIGIGAATLLILLVAGSVNAAEKADSDSATNTAQTDAVPPHDDLAADTITMVVMDPLALPLSCPCVKGYAQRNYNKLGEKLEKELGHPVRVIYNESLTAALKGDAHGRADVVIGKHSVVLFDAKRSGLKLTPVASLTGRTEQQRKPV